MKKEGMDLKEQGKAYEKVWKEEKKGRNDKIVISKNKTI